MRDQRDLTIQIQAEIITKLNKHLHEQTQRAADACETHQALCVAGQFYLAMQKAILDNPTLQSEWTRFLSFVKLAEQEDKLKIEPITPRYPRYLYAFIYDKLDEAEREVARLTVPDVFDSWIIKEG